MTIIAIVLKLMNVRMKMADILSQEEIDALLEVVEDDEEVVYANSYRISKLEETLS